MLDDLVKQEGGQETLITALEDLGDQVSVNEDAYKVHILEALYELGGSAEPDDVLIRVERKLHFISRHDLETLDNGRLRWRKNAYWARNVLRGEELISSAVHGVWQLTQKGTAEVERLKGIHQE